MASVNIKSNADEVFKTIGVDLLGLLEVTAFRQLMFDLIDMFQERIHANGQATDGSQIGTYSPGYMAVRTGIFGNTARISRGKNKGKQKDTDAGVFTKGKNKGKPRPQYKRDGSTKIIVSLTRKLESQYAVIATDDGYDIGWIDHEAGDNKENPTNYQKARFVEEVKHKTIFDPSQAELDYIDEFIDKKINDLLK